MLSHQSKYCFSMLAGVFLIPYFFMLFFCGLPLFLMEMVIGQYSGSGPANVFEAAPIFKGMAFH